MSGVLAYKTLGKYRPLAELGRGGMATVYLASSTGPAGFSKLVVVKEMLEEYANDPEFREMFLGEARLAARLHHPNIVQTNEITEDDGRLMMVMEYLEGQSLAKVRHRFSRSKRLTLGHVLWMLVDLLDGLHAAHELSDYDGTPLNVVHRDISPHNVFVTYAGVVKLVDFGIAKAATTASSTRTGIVKGKIRYMAPEQAFGRGIDRRSDVFAVGVILWEAVTGRRMWVNLPDAAVMHALAAGDIPKVAEFAEVLDPALARICDRALAAAPDDRYPTAAEMREDLLAWLEANGVRSDAREIGKLVTGAFEQEREQIRVVIEEQMRRAKSLSESEYAGAGLPRIDAGARNSLHTPAAGARSSGFGRPDEDSVSSSVPSLSGTPPAAVLAPPAAAPARTDRLALIALAALSFTAVGALLAVLLLRAPTAVANAPAAGQAAPPVSASTIAPTPSLAPQPAPAAALGSETDPASSAAVPSPTASAPPSPPSPTAPALPSPTVAAPAPAPKPAAPKSVAVVAPTAVDTAPSAPPASAPPPAPEAPKAAPKPSLEIRPNR
jgi:serine/threonine protein kinase